MTKWWIHRTSPVLIHPVPHLWFWVRLTVILRNKHIMTQACTMLTNRISANTASRS